MHMCMCDVVQDALWKRMNAAQSPVVDDDMSAAAQEVAGRMTALARQLYPVNDAAAAQAQLVAGAWSHCAQATISQKKLSAPLVLAACAPCRLHLRVIDCVVVAGILMVGYKPHIHE